MPAMRRASAGRRSLEVRSLHGNLRPIRHGHALPTLRRHPREHHVCGLPQHVAGRIVGTAGINLGRRPAAGSAASA